MSTYRVRTPLQLAANLVGPPVAVLAAWLMTLGHNSGDGGMTQANVALVMAVVTVLFALLDWLAGITTSVPAPLVWSAAIATPANDLGLVLARIERTAPGNIPEIGRPAGSYQLLEADLVLPVYGAALRLERRHPEGRWLVLTPRDGMGPLTLDRRAVMAFADTIELALDTSDTEPATTLAS